MASSSCEIQIFHTPKACCFGEGEPEEQDKVIVLSRGEMVCYVIPSFDVFTVPLIPLRIKGYSRETDEEKCTTSSCVIALYWTEIIRL